MRRAVSLAFVLLTLAGTIPGLAHFAERTDSLWGFVSRSEVVMVGTVVKSQRFEERGHTTAPGAVRLRVEELLKGEAADSELGVLVEGKHQPRYDDGERVLIFANRQGGVLRSLQNRSEKISATEHPEELAVVRRYVKVLAQKNNTRQRRELKDMTIELLASPDPRLRDDAVFDLNRPGLLDATLGDASIARLGELALEESRPLLLREGIVAKLGILAERKRKSAVALLGRLAVELRSSAVRVTAINALVKVGGRSSTRAMLASLAADDRYVRLAAVEGLGALEASEAVRPLAARQNDSDPGVRFAALKALFRIGTPEARAELRKIRDQGSPEQVRMVERAAEQIARDQKGNVR